MKGETASKLAGKETSTPETDTVTERLSTRRFNRILIKLQYQGSRHILMKNAKLVGGKTLKKEKD